MRLLTDDETFAVFGGADSGDDSGDDSGNDSGDDSGSSSDSCDNIGNKGTRDLCYLADKLSASCPDGWEYESGGRGVSFGDGSATGKTVTVVCKGSSGSDD